MCNYHWKFTLTSKRMVILTATDLAEQFPPEVEVLNPELVIATMDETAHLVMDVVIERGKGYVPSTKNKKIQM